MKRIAVMSGKGGVGKSFVSAGLAHALQEAGHKTAILDADVTGASIPRLFGLDAMILGTGPDGRIKPIVSAGGVKIVSISFAIPDDATAVAWRGPLISSAIRQLHDDSNWDDVDYLVIDLPPGTSDAALTVLQDVKPDDTIIVATPQNLVHTIARKSVDLVMKSGAKVLGVVENMSYLSCPNCGEKIELFGVSGVEKAFAGAGVPLLASIPMIPEITKLSDEGRIEETDSVLFAKVVEKITTS